VPRFQIGGLVVRATTDPRQMELGGIWAYNEPTTCRADAAKPGRLSSLTSGQRRSQEFDLGGDKWVKETKQPHKKFKVD